MANSVDPDETPRSAASHLGLYCLLRPVCPNIYGKYGNPATKAAGSASISQALKGEGPELTLYSIPFLPKFSF